MEDATSKALPAFDFEAHRRAAIEQYEKKRQLYDDFAWAVRDILSDAAETRRLKINVIQCRAKERESFARKAATPDEQNLGGPKYRNPLSDITDLAGVRVITFFPSTVKQVCELIQEEFDVTERVDHTASAVQAERLGYQSIHYVVELAGNRRRLAEYRRFDGLVAEIQVRTVLQHAWAEIEHDIRYKSKSTIPQAISRRFMTLAGLLEIADREFEAIQEADDSLRATARVLVEEGRLGEVEITPDALRSYLDSRLGPDDRISDFTYDWTAKQLRKVGFQNLRQVEECTTGFDHDHLSRIALGTRSGQVSRFEVLLVAGMGEKASLFWGIDGVDNVEALAPWVAGWLTRMKEDGIAVRSYNPKPDGQI